MANARSCDAARVTKTEEREPASPGHDLAPLDRCGQPERFVICLHGRIYQTPFPVDLGRLDVIGRQIVLEAARCETAAGGEQIDLADAIWNAVLRADVVAHAGKVVANQTDATITALQKARHRHDFDAMSKHAKVLLEVVDAMEALY